MCRAIARRYNIKQFLPTEEADIMRTDIAMDWRQTTFYKHVGTVAYPILFGFPRCVFVALFSPLRHLSALTMCLLVSSCRHIVCAARRQTLPRRRRIWSRTFLSSRSGS